MIQKTLFPTLIIIIVINSFVVKSQVSDSLFNASCSNEDLIILSEDMEVSIIGKKLYFMHAVLSNELTIVINSSDGIEKIQPFTLPQRFDELYIYHAPAVRNIDWEYQNIKVHEFNANRVIDGKVSSELDVTTKIIKKRVLNESRFFGDANIYQYYINDLKKGDTIQVVYTYDIDFNGNWFKLLSNRLFFNGKYPKKSFNLKWCYSAEIVVDSLFVNHAPPEVYMDENQLCYSWKFNNLTGCIDEPASRPYLTLPYFVFVPKPYDLEYTHYDSYKQEFIPIYYIGADQRQGDLNVERNDNIIGNKNKNNLYYQKVANHIIKQTPNDTTGRKMMSCFQRYLVDSTEYDPAINYYKHNEDRLRQRAGVDLWGHKVSDQNVDRIYANIIYKLNLNYLSAYPVDSRVGVISPMYNSTIKDNDMLFAVILNDKSVGMVLPKTDKNNYYFDELPFYYEDIPVLLLDVSDFLNRSQHGGKRNYNTDFRKWVTKKNNWKDNYRKIHGKVNINDKTAVFQTRISLSGQYSTLTRFVYDNKPIDSTINPRYVEPIWQICDSVKVIESKISDQQIYYPFKTKINMEYSANNLIYYDNEVYSLECGRWFKLVYHDGINNQVRSLDYYPDFIGTDSYSYMLEFEKPIEIVSVQDTISCTNRYAHLSLITKQVDPQHILLRCNYNILTNLISKDDIELVRNINRQIEAISDSKILFKYAQ
jgi:hypothetical protein